VAVLDTEPWFALREAPISRVARTCRWVRFRLDTG